MITDLQTSVLSTEKQINDLKTENERLSQEQVHPDNPVSQTVTDDKIGNSQGIYQAKSKLGIMLTSLN